MLLFYPLHVTLDVVAPVPAYIFDIESPLSAQIDLIPYINLLEDLSYIASISVVSNLSSYSPIKFILQYYSMLCRISRETFVWKALVLSRQSKQFVLIIVCYYYKVSFVSSIKLCIYTEKSLGSTILLTKLFIYEKSVSLTIAWKSIFHNSVL